MTFCSRFVVTMAVSLICRDNGRFGYYSSRTVTLTGGFDRLPPWHGTDRQPAVFLNQTAGGA